MDNVILAIDDEQVAVVGIGWAVGGIVLDRNSCAGLPEDSRFPTGGWGYLPFTGECPLLARRAVLWFVGRHRVSRSRGRR